MTLRIGIGGILHETNTFAPATELASFSVARGDRIRLAFGGTRSYIGGMLDGVDGGGHEAVLLLFAEASPSGRIRADAYGALKTELVERARGSGRLDALLLALHGAGSVEGIDSLEVDLCGSLRELGAPVVLTLDLHANLPVALAPLISGAFGVREYPHVDMYDRGIDAARFAIELARGGPRRFVHIERLPMLLSPITTEHPALGQVNMLCAQEASAPGMTTVTFFHGFPYADLPQLGSSVLAMGIDATRTRQAAKRVAAHAWSVREQLAPEAHSPEEAVRRAMTYASGPVVINETSDNTGAGAPGDGTRLLRAMLDARLERACFAFIVDPEAVNAAERSGVGSKLRLLLGGKSDDLHGEPLDVEAYVACVSDGRFRIRSGMGQNEMYDLGHMVRLRIGGIDVVVSSRRDQTLDSGPFIVTGIDPRDFRIVGLKSSHHFRAFFRDIATAIVTADSPGLSTVDVTVFERRRCPHPVWPLDPAATYATVTA